MMLVLKNVSKTFNPGTITEKKALVDINLTIEDGDFITVIGGNGAGKSTLLNLIAGVHQCDGGTISYSLCRWRTLLFNATYRPNSEWRKNCYGGYVPTIRATH